jgi:excisionase family DNA binding protein
MDPTDRWCGTQEAARLTGMSPEWVRTQIKAGRLKARRFTTGGRTTYRIRLRDLEDFLRRYSDGQTPDER